MTVIDGGATFQSSRFEVFCPTVKSIDEYVHWHKVDLIVLPIYAASFDIVSFHSSPPRLVLVYEDFEALFSLT